MKMKNTKKVYVHYLKKILTTTVLIFLFSILAGQESSNETPPLKERIFYGGNFSLQFGTITNIEISPIVGIWVLPRIAVAIGPTYTFYKFDPIKTDIFGGRTYVQYVLFRDLDKFIPLGIHTSFFFAS